MHFRHYKQTAIPSRVTVARVRHNGRGFGVAVTWGPSSVSAILFKRFYPYLLLNHIFY